MSTHLEIERKFIIEFPKSWFALSELFDGLIDVKRISQTYLKSEEGEQAARVRKTEQGLTGDTEIVYHYNQKKPVESGVHEEKEYEISKKEYEDYLKDANPDKVAVEKTRFVFDFQDQVFELDVFKGPLKGLAILELELKDKDQKIEMPPFLKVLEEVTKDKKFTNFSLADKKLNKKMEEQ